MATRNSKNANTANTATNVKTDENVVPETVVPETQIPEAAANLIKQLASENRAYSAISTVLVTLGHAKNAKQANEWLTAMEVKKASAKKNIVDSMYEYLEAEPRTQADFYSWVKENGTENTLRWFKSHDKVRELTNRLHVSLSGVEFTDVAAKIEK